MKNKGFCTFCVHFALQNVQQNVSKNLGLNKLIEFLLK